MTDEEPMPHFLSCVEVSKHFGALKAMNKMSFGVTRNEILGITGPNGAGKTTLFEVISGFSKATSGKIVLDGEDITALPPHVICNRGMMRVFQSTAAFDSMPAWQNVYIGHAFGRRRAPLRSLIGISRADRMACLEALDRVGLAAKANAPMAQLSVLERKFLMMASALVCTPKLLLLDEPVGGLTHEESDAVFNLLTRLKQDGATIVVIEHVMRFLVRIADRIIVMHHGELIFDGAPSLLARDETVRRVYLGEKEAERMNRAEWVPA